MNETASEEVSAPGALTVQQRAHLALNITDDRLAELRRIAAKSSGIVRITNPDGYKECHAARMALKNLRLDIERAAETARADAQAYAKAVIAGQKLLLAEIEPEEQRLKAIQDAEDARVEEDKRRAREAEQARLAGINQRLEWIRNRALDNVGAPLAKIADEIVALESLPITAELYGEFTDQAGAALALVLDKLRTMHRQASEHAEREAALAVQRAELERKQAELDAADRERAERMQREDAERKARQQEEDDARKFAADYDEAMREDAARNEAAIAAELARAREAEAAAERERKAKERAALEVKADPWGAISRIREICRDRPLDAFAMIRVECEAAMQARDELARLA